MTYTWFIRACLKFKSLDVPMLGDLEEKPKSESRRLRKVEEKPVKSFVPLIVNWYFSLCYN